MNREHTEKKAEKKEKGRLRVAGVQFTGITER